MVANKLEVLGIDSPQACSSIPTGDGELQAFLSKLYADADSLIDTSPAFASAEPSDTSLKCKAGWKIGKLYYANDENPTRTAKRPGQPLNWHLRSSCHTGPKQSYDDLRSGLFVQHTPNEKEYIEGLHNIERLQVWQDDVVEAWLVQYEIPPPTTNRDFCILPVRREITGQEANSGLYSTDTTTVARRFQVISIPVTHPKGAPAQGYVRARYASVEDVRELVPTSGDEPKKQVVWTMATMSDPAGLIPSWISEKVLPSKIVEDVPSCVKWLKNRQ
ncbi:uncharacterized protein L969DRAFT_18102 [Mixia osmundae IAM 14324]|uniref:DUF3074 domain-containing protein n=1 Tax=Mixia osmundae (strain CBS 9802 / IAM 14324 / JCM 22182 / KY 12970) TaxID=764103 RepID=G7E6X8_MIXOS|nr:uncharacterized protein L969DRAFT_18102 [Mixia osmundae IAM 14324]KEI39029.1 hypothetical protein L969DRAFT_18102 [Mixia osmundae IAM 14324]GAA98588.1 hypothetical protein E5Q_05275 [Mixia osmundae IAM 14324]